MSAAATHLAPLRPPRGLAWLLCRRFPGLYESHYVFFKLVLDPVYRAVHLALRQSNLPLLDIGCGPGLLATYLRACGHQQTIRGFDYDPRKIETAREVTKSLPDCHFSTGDARETLPEHTGNVTILDILQFFTREEQTALLELAAARVAPDGVLIIRSSMRGVGWRFRVSRAGDWFAKVTFWMKEHPTTYPEAQELAAVLEKAGLEGSMQRLSGWLPFNNFLLIYRRSESSVDTTSPAAAVQDAQ